MAPDRVADAMRRCPRTRFLPPDQHAGAGSDAPLPIGHEQTNSQPSTVAAMLRLLDVHEGHDVLDVGSGSGWTSAILGELVGPTGSVEAVERVAELVTRSRAALAEDAHARVRVHHARPGTLGLPGLAPFDRILVSAEPAELPLALVDQLAADGVMVIPVAGEMLRVVRGPDGPHVTRHGRYRFVPLVTD
ncbi:protein-L-isoaspartate O-methyltransferase family protein [Janibacter anophelis]|uniref:protein-L-isoaspartate O-methyltransferase family protein n=1 Tax=Janibacter anophelis TaxID=319054 RepID=UPI003F7FB983